MTDTETLQLNSIFNRLLLDLEVAGNFDLKLEDRDQALNLLKTAVGEVLEVVGQRCPACDSVNLLCVDCEGTGISNDVREMVRGYTDEP